MAKAALTADAADHVIQMAWQDRTLFDAIEAQFGFSEVAVIRLMRSPLKPRAFALSRERVTGRKTKHLALRDPDVSRFKSADQKS